MNTFVQKSIVAVIAAMTMALALMASPAGAKSLYDDYKYYSDGYVDDRGSFRPYDYNYYHKDGYRYDSFYGDYDTYNTAYANYRSVRDRDYYGSNYSDYYNTYEDYVRGFGTGYSYDNSYDYSSPYTYRAGSYDNSYDYSSPYTYRAGSYDNSYDYGYGYNYGCAYYDYECTYHKDRDRDGDYSYLQIAPDRYVRSDYYNNYYASERDRYLSSFSYRYY